MPASPERGQKGRSDRAGEILPLTSLPLRDVARVRFILTDIDDTLTLDGRLPAVAYMRMEMLESAGIGIVPVTGRPAGWCDLIARFWPVAGVVGENGALYFRYDRRRRRMVRRFAVSKAEQEERARRIAALAEKVVQDIPGTALSADQPFRLADAAIDFAEDVAPLPASSVQRIVEAFVKAGAIAKVSSIHVNAWFGSHDKLTMSQRFLREAFGFDPDAAPLAVAYIGDSPNDEPMFSAFPLSVGVANVGRHLASMRYKPRYITRASGGFGFSEFAGIVLGALDRQRESGGQ